jgi:restriction system protein
MPIPDFQTLMLPLLQLAADGQECLVRDARETLADQFTLSPEEKSGLLPSDRDDPHRFGWPDRSGDVGHEESPGQAREMSR